MDRQINLLKLLNKSSHFLLGPRGTGKSYQIRQEFSEDVDIIDLLDSNTYLSLAHAPSTLGRMISKNAVVIDEIQRIPELLNEVHKLIEERGIRFLLTGSSARKLRRTGVNLLAGRALPARMFPLTWKELNDEGIFDLDKYLKIGGLPKAWTVDYSEDYLYGWVETYLKEEVQAEALVRSLTNYHRFLKTAALCNGRLVNFTEIGSDAQLSPNTVKDYFQILEDTLAGFMLLPWKGAKRKAASKARFYFFDPGVANAAGMIRDLEPHGNIYGRNFEQFLVNEVRAWLAYTGRREELNFWRSTTKLEVDLVVGGRVAIEVKSSQRVTERDHKGLKAIAEEGDFQHLLLVSRDPIAQQFDSGVRHLPWEASSASYGRAVGCDSRPPDKVLPAQLFSSKVPVRSRTKASSLLYRLRIQ